MAKRDSFDAQARMMSQLGNMERDAYLDSPVAPGAADGEEPEGVPVVDLPKAGPATDPEPAIRRGPGRPPKGGQGVPQGRTMVSLPKDVALKLRRVRMASMFAGERALSYGEIMSLLIDRGLRAALPRVERVYRSLGDLEG